MRSYPGGFITATAPTVSSTAAKGIWTLEEALQYKKAGNWPVTSEPDTYFNSTVLLLHGDGTNGAQNNTFLDSSTNNFTITRNGNTTQGTFTPFSVASNNWSNYFNNSTGLTINYGTSNQTFWNNDFTLEFWINCPTETFGSILSSWADQTFGGGSWGLVVVDGIVGISNRQSSGSNQGNFLSSGTTRVDDGAWHHVVITQVTGANKTFRLFVDGILRGYKVETNWTQGTSASVIYVGYQGPSTYEPENRYLLGYLSNLRLVTNIVSTYSTSVTTLGTTVFTPPTSGLTNITGTNFLICQSNRFVDNSSNAYSITRNGDVSVQAFSPFAPTAAYSAATNGGSARTDGTGDYLTVTNGSTFTFTGDFTIEGWVYSGFEAITGGAGVTLIDTRNQYDSVNWSFGIYTYSGYVNNPQFIYSGGTLSSSINCTPNAWNHIALTRSGTTLKIFVNGVQGYSGTVSGTISTGGATNNTILSGLGGTNYLSPAYVSGLRILNGTGYSSISVPTAPPTAITNTSLLLNFTNAGITDSTAKNNLETVGNAQISTAQSKFGGSSMYFDGTGDRLVFPYSPWIQMGNGDWTIEMWVYFANAPGSALYYNLYTNRASVANYSPIAVFINNARKIEAYFSTSGSSWTSSITTSTALSTSTWTHIAVVRNGSTAKIYINGTADANTATISGSLFTNTASLFIGGEAGGNDMNGYIDDLRITKGVARYTANFTAPTKAFSDL